MTQTAERTRTVAPLSAGRLPAWGDSYAEAVVDLDAIRHNTAVLSSATTGALMAVVKANAFGHGALEVSRTALSSGATWLGVTSIAEARELRAAGIEAPLLAWLHLPTDDLGSVVRGDIDLSVSSLEHLEAVAAAGRAYGVPIAIHLKVDSGLRRNGADPASWPLLVNRASQLVSQGCIRVRGIWSHLACADEPASTFNGRQIRVFEAAVGCARGSGLEPEVVHLANSAALLTRPETHYSLARVGIALYGVEPVAGADHGLWPAMTLRARTIMTRRVPAGTAVSYGHEYVTHRAANLALVPVGYADGIPRAAGGRAEVLVGGHRHGVAGRVAMDQFVVDAGDASVAIGDEVVVFGPGSNGEPTAADWAGWAGTNPHEILTGIGNRVTRRHLPARPAVPRTRVAVLFGGRSAEHAVSCQSGAAIMAALDPERYDVVPVRISLDGAWSAGGKAAALDIGSAEPTGQLPPLSADRWGSLATAMRTLRSVDVVVPALHGPNGEDGTVQGMLSTLGVAFVGSGVLASAVGMDKAVAKQIFRSAGLAVAAGVVLPAGNDSLSHDERDRLGLPVVVKPARAGSSQGVTKVRSWEELAAAVALARSFDAKVLVEAAVPGREIDIAVLQHPDGRLEAGPPLEVHYGPDQDHFSYQAKYSDPATAFEIPARLDPDAVRLLQERALAVFELLGCAGLLRVDFFYDDAERTVVINEVNTFPGFSTASQFPQIWAAAGVSYPQLVDILVRTAVMQTPSLPSPASLSARSHA